MSTLPDVLQSSIDMWLTDVSKASSAPARAMRRNGYAFAANIVAKITPTAAAMTAVHEAVTATESLASELGGPAEVHARTTCVAAINSLSAALNGVKPSDVAVALGQHW